MADIVTATAFALLLVSAYELRGAAVGWREGMFWGLAGFASFTLAPCLGLPPEVPGTEAGPLVARQVWWIGTVAATSAGLGLMFLQRRPVLTLAGVILLFAPHLIGAPHPEEFSSSA